MRYEARDDGELLELAQAGWAPAFAVLVHRHAPALLTAFADEPDPVERTVDVFLRAMRQLPERGADTVVGTWLFDLAGRPVPTEVGPAVEASVDHVWHELSARWPDGRRPRRRHPVLRGVAIAVGAVALGVAVPTIVLGLPPAAHDGEVETVRAQPLEEPPPEEEPEPEELPEFEFPDVTDRPAETVEETVVEVEDPAPAGPTTPTVPVAPAPPPPPDPAPTEEPVEPEPEPLPEPTVEPTPTPSPTPTAEPPPPPTDDGSGDDGTTGGTGGGA